MTADMFTDLLRSLAVLSFFLLVGTILRAKVKAFRTALLPASVIGGFLALLLGPRVWGDSSPLGVIFQVSNDWVNIWSLLPGILIVPIFASVPLGMFTGKPKNNRADSQNSGFGSKNGLGYIFISCGLLSMVGSVQGILGYATNVVYSKFNPGVLYRVFGYELPSGFAGGHGTAGAVGRILQGFGESYWEVAQGVTTTTATIGLIGGMIAGIVIINIAARAGKTQLLRDLKDIPVELLQGFTKDVTKHESVGRMTTFGSSIETISLHLGLIFVGCGLGYYLRNLVISTGVQAFTSVPVWLYCLFAMFVLDYVLDKMGLGWAIDKAVKSRITGSISDFAIIAAIASVPVQAVLTYAVPITVMCTLGFILTYILVFKVYGWFYGENAPFEHAIIAWGALTGVMITGMMLLKICDPDYETPALLNFSMGFSLMGMLSLLTALWQMPILQFGDAMANLNVSVWLGVIWLAFALVGRVLVRREMKVPVMADA